MIATSQQRLGPVREHGGFRFRLLAPEASKVRLGFFKTLRSAMPHQLLDATRLDDGIWDVFAPGIAPGALYAWSVDGPADLVGARFDPRRFLLDPAGWEVARVPGRNGHGLSRVVEPDFDWEGVRRPLVKASDRVVYELHVKGLTRSHPGVPSNLRGTYSGLCRPGVLESIQALGVTTLELLPVHAKSDEPFLAERGLSNYWGYNTLCWFSPEPSLSSDGRGADEFRHMVREIHRAGMEVVLDVVYNHSCEAGLDGLVAGLRGTGSWYRTSADRPDALEDLTGCGNTLDFRLAKVRLLVLESLRHWVREFRVDGFRFDLASIFGRVDGDFDPSAAFFGELESDPVLKGRILVAEPWDAASGGYALGRYPDRWMEWNDRFRDDVRLFWKGEGNAQAFASRLAGSPDVFGDRCPGASVNFVACHDGFTLRDLCSYSVKRNEANGEANRDGNDWNHSDNLGVEGESSDAAILERRGLRARNLLASALLARGVPMLLAGDERGRTQGGNNNAYCQDNRISWMDWEPQAHWPNPKWVGSVLGLRREMSGLECLGEWCPATAPGVGGILLEGRDRRWLLVGRREGPGGPLPLPPGEWALRLDSSTDAGSLPPRFVGRHLPSGGEAFLVLESPFQRPT